MKKAALLSALIVFTMLVAGLVLWSGLPQDGTQITPDSALSKYTPATELPQPAAQITTSCFGLIDTTTLQFPKQEETPKGCVVRAGLRKPKGLVTVSLEHAALDSTNSEPAPLANLTGARLRLENPEQYSPVSNPSIALPASSPLSATNFLVFTTATEMTGFFVVLDEQLHPTTDVVTVSIHSVARVNDEIVTHFWQIVNSIVQNRI